MRRAFNGAEASIRLNAGVYTAAMYSIKASRSYQAQTQRQHNAESVTLQADMKHIHTHITRGQQRMRRAFDGAEASIRLNAGEYTAAMYGIKASRSYQAQTQRQHNAESVTLQADMKHIHTHITRGQQRMRRAFDGAEASIRLNAGEYTAAMYGIKASRSYQAQTQRQHNAESVTLQTSMKHIHTNNHEDSR